MKIAGYFNHSVNVITFGLAQKDHIKQLFLYDYNTLNWPSDAWLRCQESWLYLEPIFNSEDIMKQMPVEGRKFNKVDRIW